MDNENTKIKDTGSWSPFYYWIVGVVTMCALMWMLPNNYPREPWENIIRVLLGALFIFLFFVCPVWMIISAIRYWKTKDYIRATVAVFISFAISSGVGSRPNSCSNCLLTRISLLIVSTIWTGILIVLA